MESASRVSNAPARPHLVGSQASWIELQCASHVGRLKIDDAIENDMAAVNEARQTQARMLQRENAASLCDRRRSLQARVDGRDARTIPPTAAEVRGFRPALAQGVTKDFPRESLCRQAVELIQQLFVGDHTPCSPGPRVQAPRSGSYVGAVGDLGDERQYVFEISLLNPVGRRIAAEQPVSREQPEPGFVRLGIDLAEPLRKPTELQDPLERPPVRLHTARIPARNRLRRRIQELRQLPE